MSKKTANQHAQDLQHQTQEADLLATQIERQQLMQAEEAFQVSGYTEQRDLANQLLGRIQMAQGIAKLATVASLSDLAYIKGNKLYQSLAGKKVSCPDGRELATVATWEGFCEALGVSRRTVDEQLQNLREFGQEAYDAMSRAGIGYQSLRKLRQLPDEARQLVINGEAVRIGDKEEIEDLIERLAERHATEKQRLEAKVKDLEANLEVAHRLGKDKTQKIDELASQLQKRDLLPAEERAADLSMRLDQAMRDASRGLNEPSRVFAEVLDWEDAPRELRHACAQGIARLRVALDRIQQQYELPPLDLDVDDSWMQESGLLQQG